MRSETSPGVTLSTLREFSGMHLQRYRLDSNMPLASTPDAAEEVGVTPLELILERTANPAMYIV